MSSRARQILIAVLLIGVTGWAVAWSWGYLADARDAAVSARQELQSCESLSRRIELLRAGKSDNRAEPQRQIELSRQISQAAADAGLSTQITRISHEAPRRAANSNFVEKPTRIELARATLKQVIVFLHALDRPTAGLRIERLHLLASSDSPDAGTWTVDATLVHTQPDDSRKNASGPQR